MPVFLQTLETIAYEQITCEKYKKKNPLQVDYKSHKYMFKIFFFFKISR